MYVCVCVGVCVCVPLALDGDEGDERAVGFFSVLALLGWWA